MNSDQTHKKLADSRAAATQQWDIDRYLLSDPSLDRDEFEQRMFNDLPLAEQVAGSVANFALLSQAAAPLPPPFATSASLSIRKTPADGKYSWAMLTSVAVLLLVASVWQFRNYRNDSQLSQIADRWVAFDGLAVAETFGIDHHSEFQDGEDSSSLELTEQSDWLVEAAREFYLVNNEGAAG